MSDDRWTLLQKTEFILKLPTIFGPLSAVGSLLVLLALYRNQSPHRRVYQRLMTGMSLMDLIMSVAYSFGHHPGQPHPINVFFRGRDVGNGTVGTCAAQSFFIQLGSMSYTYMMFLSFFFVLTITFNIKDRTITRFIEPMMHLFAWGYGLITAIIIVAKDYANMAVTVCWIGEYPPACEVFGIPCERGQGFIDFAQVAIVVPSYINTIGIFLFLVMVSWTVFQKYRQTDKFNKSSNEWTASANRTNQAFKRHAHSVIIQCTLYTLTFFNTTFWFAFQNYFISNDRVDELSGRFYFVLALAQFFFPLQGLFNFIIFIRAPYADLRAKHPELSRLGALKAAIWNRSAETSSHEGVGFRTAQQQNNEKSGSSDGPTSTPFDSTSDKTPRDSEA